VIQSTWTLGSLAQVLEFPLETYRPLPPWAEENSSDELRRIKAEVIAAEKARESAPKSISSATVGNVSHMEQRVQLPSNITNMPVVQSLEDLDLFYCEAPPAAAPPRPQPVAPMAPASAGLEQVRLAAPAPPAGPVGTAVFGEDDESDEEEDDEDDWKYCQQAAPKPGPPQTSSDPTPPPSASSPTPAPPEPSPMAATPAPQAPAETTATGAPEGTLPSDSLVAPLAPEAALEEAANESRPAPAELPDLL
ncbi:unnamed protein product, partial [Symbiodinium sp. CCMP2456]